MKTFGTIFILLSIFLFGCSKEKISQEPAKNITIFFVDDVHAQIDNFSVL